MYLDIGSMGMLCFQEVASQCLFMKLVKVI